MVTFILCIVLNQKNVRIFIKDMQVSGLIASISVGVKDEEYAFFEEASRRRSCT